MSPQSPVETWLWGSSSGFCPASSSCFCGLSTVLVGPEHGHGCGKMFVRVAYWVGQAVSLCILGTSHSLAHGWSSCGDQSLTVDQSQEPMVLGDTLLDFSGLYQGGRHQQDKAAGGLVQGGAPDTCPVHSSLPAQASMVPNSKLVMSRQRGQGGNKKDLDFNTFQNFSPSPAFSTSGAPYFSSC